MNRTSSRPPARGRQSASIRPGQFAAQRRGAQARCRLFTVAGACPRRGFTLVELLVVIVILGLLAALILPAIQQSREASRRTQCRSHLKQIGVAVNSYQTVHGMLPPGACNGYSLHVFLLPYIDERPLYERFDFSIRHRKTGWGRNGSWPRAPAIYACPSDAGVRTPGRGPATSYAGNYGTGVQKHGYNGMFQNLQARGPVFVQHVRDGLSHTAAVAEILVSDGTRSDLRPVWNLPLNFEAPHELETFAEYCESIPTDVLTGDLWSKGRPWTDGNLSITMYNHVLPPNRKSCFNGSHVQQGSYSASSAHSGGAHLLFGDGRVTFVDNNIDLAVWRAYGSRNGGEPVGQ